MVSTKKLKPLKLHAILARVRLHKFLGDQIILTFWLTDGKLMKIKDIQKMIKLTFPFTGM